MKKIPNTLKPKCAAWMKTTVGNGFFQITKPIGDKWDPDCAPCQIRCYPKLPCLKPTARKRAIKKEEERRKKEEVAMWYKAFLNDSQKVRKILLNDCNKLNGLELLKLLIRRRKKDVAKN